MSDDHDKKLGNDISLQSEANKDMPGAAVQAMEGLSFGLAWIAARKGVAEARRIVAGCLDGMEQVEKEMNKGMS